MKRKRCLIIVIATIIFGIVGSASCEITLEWEDGDNWEETQFILNGFLLCWGTSPINPCNQNQVDVSIPTGYPYRYTLTATFLQDQRYFHSVEAYGIYQGENIDTNPSHIITSANKSYPDNRNEFIASYSYPNRPEGNRFSSIGVLTPTPFQEYLEDGNNIPLIEDVDNDGFKDQLLFNLTSGNWYKYNGETQSFELWLEGFGQKSAKQFLVDIDGNSYPDPVVYFGDDTSIPGNWYAAQNMGNGSIVINSTGPYFPWLEGFGQNSAEQFLADVDGDNLSDPTVYFCTTNLPGHWYVAKNQGSGITTRDDMLWSNHLCEDSFFKFIVDLNGNGQMAGVCYYEGY